MFKTKVSMHAMKKILSLGVFLFLSLGINGNAAEEKDFTELYEKARNEGKVVFYASMDILVAQDLANRFEKKFPGVKVEIFRTTGEAVIQRAIAEGRAGKYLYDVIHLNLPMIDTCKKHNLIGQYRLSSYNLYPKGFIDPEGYWTSTWINPLVIAYNTKLLKPSEVPQTWEGLLDPKWRGKLAMDRTKYVWSIGIRDIMGEEKGIKYLKALAAQKIEWREGMTNTLQMMSAGEFPMMAWSFVSSCEFLKAKGSPIDWVRMKSPVPIEVDTNSIGGRVPHPNAARLFYEFLFSKEGQEAFLANAKVVARSDVESEYVNEIRRLDLRPGRPLPEEEYNKAAKLFLSIFGL